MQLPHCLDLINQLHAHSVLHCVTVHVNDYPTMHYFGIPRHTQSMIAYKTLTSFSGNSSEKLYCGNVVKMPYRLNVIIEYNDDCRSSSRSRSSRRDSTSSLEQNDNTANTQAGPEDVNVEWNGDGVSCFLDDAL